MLAAMPVVVSGPLPDAAVLAVAFLVGATAPQIAPLSRSRLMAIISACIVPGRRERVINSTMAYESAADEIVFIVGPSSRASSPSRSTRGRRSSPPRCSP